MTTLYRSARMVRRIVRGLALLFLGEVTIKAACDEAAQFGWRVVAVFALGCVLASYCFYTAFTLPVRRWGHP